jgi:hypothetical protein
MSTTATPVTVAVLAKPSLWSRVKAEIKLIEQKIEHDEPAIEKVALGVIAILTPAATAVLAVTDPALAPLVAPIASRITGGLAALTVAVEDAGSAPTVASIANGIVSQLTAFETTAGIKDPVTVSKIGTIATELQTVADAFSSAVPAPAATETVAIEAASIGSFFHAVGHGLKETGKALGEGAVVGAVVVANADTNERHVVVVNNARQVFVRQGEAVPLQPGEELLESHPGPDGRVRVVIGRPA